MTKFGKLIVLGILLIAAGIGLYFAQKQEPVVVPVVPENIVETPVEPETPTVPEVTENDEVRETLGNKDDLISLSILPNAKVHGVVSYRGVIKGGYFFEGNILINVLDANKKVLKSSNAVAKTDWMTAGPVDFEGNIDFTGLPAGPGYFEVHNDNASGLPENDKSVLIPIVIQ